jgi:hypothetical protein
MAIIYDFKTKQIIAVNPTVEYKGKRVLKKK